ncbi:ABC transporter ATP-binding protein [Nocardia sp. NBC_01329]|uniref:ABC transporter ATP-binding protein n=1 Tax=Nocardia sp. NBC_01329 TaxID=2903594 RepID=UPI002E135688|nr:ABC transporter ATP-binding protein [Nocardia sp. NBC_01329]
MSGDVVLAAENLHAGYGPVPVVHAVDLAVSSGEILAIVGANGAGKTTLLSALSGLLPPAEGRLIVDGVPVRKVSPGRLIELGVALVPEGRRLFNGLTVDEHLRMGLWKQRLGRRAAAERRDRVVELFPILDERRSSPAEVLSGGEQQMLAIGLALMRAPRLLMLDEPSIGLAPVIIDRVFDVLASLCAEGQAIIIVEQRVQKVLARADRAAVLQNGRVVVTGPAASLMEDPRLQAAYLGTKEVR